jgi:hypothetical protein
VHFPNLPEPALLPFLPLHPNNIAVTPLKNLALACQAEIRTAKLCRLPVARARPFLKSEECHLPTLLHLYRLACRPRRAAESCIHEVTASAGDTERPETGPNVERANGRPLALLSIFSRPDHGSSSLVHRAYFRDPCTVLHKRKISAGARAPHNRSKPLLLRRNWLRSANPGTSRPSLCASETPLAGYQTVPPKTRILWPTRKFVFSAAPRTALLPRRPTNSRGFVPTLSAAIRAQRCTNPKPLPLAAPWITKANRATYQKLASFRKNARCIRGPRPPTCRADG